MKRWIVAGCTLFLLLVLSVYIFIPSQLTVVNIVPLKCNVNAVDRVIGDTAHWSKWWPGDVAGFVQRKRLMRAEEIGFPDKGMELDGLLSVFPLINPDSAFLQWESSFGASVNPVERIGQYGQAKRLKQNMEEVLHALRVYCEKRENIYGIAIEE